MWYSINPSAEKAMHRPHRHGPTTGLPGGTQRHPGHPSPSILVKSLTICLCLGNLRLKTRENGQALVRSERKEGPDREKDFRATLLLSLEPKSLTQKSMQDEDDDGYSP